MRELVSAHLVDKLQLSQDTCSFTFAAADEAFADCEAGAHIDMHLPAGFVRSYSLTDWDPAGAQVSVAVRLERTGRGGSAAMNELKIGSAVQIGHPRNNFPLRGDDQPIVLIGGGIGITPLYSMARVLRSRNQQFDLHYAVRTRDAAAFDTRLCTLDLDRGYHLHCSDTDGRMGAAGLLEHYPQGTHFYVCGPDGMLADVRQANKLLGRGIVFSEHFSAISQNGSPPEKAFQVELNSTGEQFEIPVGSTILRVLRDAGHDIDYSCAEGTCGTCITDVLEGEVDHRDSILTEEERVAGDCLCVCVSRAKGNRLILDL